MDRFIKPLKMPLFFGRTAAFLDLQVNPFLNKNVIHSNYPFLY